jgi:hypothetical protein
MNAEHRTPNIQHRMKDRRTMKKVSDLTYSRIFLIGALFNLSFAIPGLLLPRFVATLAYGPDMVASVFSNYHAYSFYNIVWGAILKIGRAHV